MTDNEDSRQPITHPPQSVTEVFHIRDYAHAIVIRHGEMHSPPPVIVMKGGRPELGPRRAPDTRPDRNLSRFPVRPEWTTSGLVLSGTLRDLRRGEETISVPSTGEHLQMTSSPHPDPRGEPDADGLYAMELPAGPPVFIPDPASAEVPPKSPAAASTSGPSIDQLDSDLHLGSPASPAATSRNQHGAVSADADSGPGPVPLDPTDEHVEAAGGSLSAIQQQALLLSSQGKPDTVVGPMCGFSPKWVQRLRKRPEAVEFLRAVNAEVINEVEGGIRMGMIESVTAAREVLAGNNDSARMRAVTFFGGAFESICASSEQAAVVDGLRREIADLRAQVAELIDEQEDQ